MKITFLSLLLIGLLAITPVHATDGLTGLDSIVTAVEAAVTAKTTPVIVFDLDGTLFYTDQRHRFILLEWCHDIGHRDFVSTAKLVEKVTDQDCTYKMDDTLKTLGVSDPAAIKSINDFWWERFFKSSYLMIDKPLPGAADFANKVHKAGAFLVYLTGRDVPGMLVGTTESLKLHGFPVSGERVRMMLKPDPKDKDHAFKETAAKEIATLGKPVALFENQPRNLELLMKAFPEAVAVLVDTNFNPTDKTVLPETILRIKSY